MFKKNVGCLVVVGLLLYPASYAFAGEPAFFTQMKDACRSSGGRPVAENYNDWVSGGGCICPGSSSGSGQPTCPSGSSSSNSSASSGRDYEAERRVQDQANAARRAEEERQAELERQRREAENKRRIEEAARQAKFLEDRDAAASTLRGSTGASVSSGGVLRGSAATSGSTSLRGSSTDTGLRGLKSDTTQTPNLDPMVVDARNVPSGLPKALDNAIANAYASSPPGVSDRVRKGFQAVMNQDWKVAKAWFQDALNRDPANAGLKRLVDLSEYPQAKGNKPKPPATNRTLNPADKAQIKATMAALDRIGDGRLEQEMAEALLDYSRNGSRKQPGSRDQKEPSVSTSKKQPQN